MFIYGSEEKIKTVCFNDDFCVIHRFVIVSNEISYMCEESDDEKQCVSMMIVVEKLCNKLCTLNKGFSPSFRLNGTKKLAKK